MNMPEDHPDSPGVATTIQDEAAAPKLLPPYRVLLHNDDVNNMLDVVGWLTELTPLTRAAAAEVTLEAHMRGMAPVVVVHHELAEFYRDRLRSRLLTVSIEPTD